MNKNAFTDSGNSPPESSVDAACSTPDVVTLSDASLAVSGSSSLSPTKKRVKSATSSAKSTRQVSPEVAGFIERVVVPALVKRYIAQLSSTGEHGG